MYENARTIRLIPDKPGRGGIKSGVSTSCDFAEAIGFNG